MTNTPLPTSTPTLTPTITPTMTPSPTITPTPTIEPPSQLSTFFEKPQVTYFENFDQFTLEEWNTQPCQTINNGVLELNCTDLYFARKSALALHDGEGIMIDFKHVQQTEIYYWEISLKAGTWGQPDWKVYGISEDSKDGPAINIVSETNWLGFPINWIKSDVWYRLAMAIDENGKIAILVWERDNPDAQPHKYINTFGKEWAGLAWIFIMSSANGNVVLNLDNYYQFSFSKIK